LIPVEATRHVGIAGAGFSGAVIARGLAEAGCEISVFEARDHIAGNCHTARDPNGVMVHRYGPHIFHTNDDEVWSFVNRYAEMERYDHRVFTTTRSGVYSMPVNLLTINQLLGTTMSPTEAAAFLEQGRTRTSEPPGSFHDAALASIGPVLFEEFFQGYTEKQWGRSTADLPASVFGRLPVRTDYRSSYFSHPHQGIPRLGYTVMVERILDHPSIDVRLATPIDAKALDQFDHAVWTGPLDAYFDFSEGRLPYRTLDFEEEDHLGDFQGCPVMNYAERSVPFTRITEHKHFAPWESHERTTIFREFPREHREGDIPYYPVRLAHGQALLDRYVELALGTSTVTFAGRLGTFRYIDMDVTIREALDTTAALIDAFITGSSPPVFSGKVTG
jgi:UDP-galactopyranose mutase